MKKTILTLSVIVAVLISIATTASASVFNQSADLDTFGIYASVNYENRENEGSIGFNVRIKNTGSYNYALGEYGGITRDETSFDWNYDGFYDEETGEWNYITSHSIIDVRRDFRFEVQIVQNPIDNGNFHEGGSINQNLFGTSYYSSSWLNVENDEMWADSYLSMTGLVLDYATINLNTNTRLRSEWGEDEFGNWGIIYSYKEDWLEISGYGYGSIDLDTLTPIQAEIMMSSMNLTVVPEPATLIILGFGALATLRRRRK